MSGRHQPVIEESTVERIREAALTCFSRHGYDGTSMLEIARAAGVSKSAVYHYFESKQALLFELIDTAHDGAIAQTEGAVLSADPGDPVAQLEAAIWAHSDYHTRFRRESFVGNTELRSLDPERRSRIVAKRDYQNLLLRRIIVDGVDAGVFDVPDPRATGRALLLMCGAISTWYNPAGPKTPRQIARDYVDMALRMTCSSTARRGGGRASMRALAS